MFYIKQELPINGQIRAKEVQLISDDGQKMGIVPLSRALELAGDKKLDLVLVSPNSTVPVCKIMNYGKYKFEQAKKEKEARKKQKVVEKVEKELEHVKLEDEVSDIPCDKCGRMMVIKYGRYGKFLACPRISGV